MDYENLWTELENRLQNHIDNGDSLSHNTFYTFMTGMIDTHINLNQNKMEFLYKIRNAIYEKDFFHSGVTVRNIHDFELLTDILRYFD